jgi:hypothetical protein
VAWQALRAQRERAEVVLLEPQGASPEAPPQDAEAQAARREAEAQAARREAEAQPALLDAAGLAARPPPAPSA